MKKAYGYSLYYSTYVYENECNANYDTVSLRRNSFVISLKDIEDDPY
jgi:hypothetical protein